MFKKIYNMLFFLVIGHTTMAQLQVAKIGVEQGLSNETIRSIYQDKNGFMWFGTLDGLNRYDGYSFKVYHNRFQDTSSLLSNVIYGITEDRQGNIWLGTRLGVCRLNRLYDNFSTVYYTNAKNKKSIRLDREVIKTVTCDAKNNILIASELQGLMVCNDASLTAVQIPFADANNENEYQYGVQSICFDKNGRTLVFVQGKGLCNLNYVQHKLQLLNADVKYVSSMLPDGDTVWMASTTGIYCYVLSTNQVKQVSTIEDLKLNPSLNITLCSDGAQNIYIGTIDGGLNNYNKITKQISYIHSGFGRSDLSGSGIYALLRDKVSRLWIGTRRGGINIINRDKQKFVTISHEPGNPNSLSGNFI